MIFNIKTNGFKSLKNINQLNQIQNRMMNQFAFDRIIFKIEKIDLQLIRSRILEN